MKNIVKDNILKIILLFFVAPRQELDFNDLLAIRKDLLLAIFIINEMVDFFLFLYLLRLVRLFIETYIETDQSALEILMKIIWLELSFQAYILTKLYRIIFRKDEDEKDRDES